MAGNAPEVARAVVTILPSMEGSQRIISEELGAAAESAGKSAGAKGGSSMLGSMGSVIKGGVGAIGVATATIAAGTVAAGKAFADAAQDVSSYGDNIDKMSQKIGISAEAYQEWDYVFQRSGADISKLQTGMKTLSGVIADAGNGSEGAAEKLNAIGLSIADLGGKTQEEQLALVIGKLQEMGPSAERTAAASDLLGKSAVDMAAVLNMTAEDTQALIDEAHEYGMVMSDESVKASADFQDSMTRMQGTMSGLKNSMIGELLPAATQVTDGLANLFKGDMSGADQMASGIQSIIEGLTGAIPAILQTTTSIIQAIANTIPTLLPVLISAIVDVAPQLVQTLVTLAPTFIEGIIQLVTAIASNINAIITPILTALPNIIIAIVNGLITALPELIKGAIQLVLGVVAAIPTIISALITALPEVITGIVTGLMDCLPELVAGVVQLVAMLALQMPQITITLVATMPDIIKSLIDGIKAAWPAMITAFKTLFKQIIPTIMAWGNDLVTNGKAAINKLITTVQTVLATIVPKFKTAFTNVINTVVKWGSDMLAKGREAASKLVNAVAEKIRELPGQLIDIGKNIVEGLWEGISGSVDWLIEKIKGFCSNALGAIKSFFGIKSPSRVMRDQVGKMIAAGVALGITDNEGLVEKAMTGLNSIMSSRVEMDLATDTGGINSTTFNNTITVNGAEDPEAWTRGFVRTLQREARMAYG